MDFREYLEDQHIESEFVDWLNLNNLLNEMEDIDDEEELEDFLHQYNCSDDFIEDCLDIWESYLEDEVH